MQKNLHQMITNLLHVFVSRDGDTGPPQAFDDRLGSAVITDQRIPGSHDQLLKLADGAGCEEGSAEPAPIDQDLLGDVKQPERVKHRSV